MTQEFKKKIEEAAGNSYPFVLGNDIAIEIQKAKQQAFLTGANHVLADVEILRGALKEVDDKRDMCIFGTIDLEKTPERAFRQGSHYAWYETSDIARKALKSFDARYKNEVD